MGSEEGKDGSKGANIVRGRLRFFGGEVDVAAVVSDKNVIVSATRFHGQLTSEVGSREPHRLTLIPRNRREKQYG